MSCQRSKSFQSPEPPDERANPQAAERSSVLLWHTTSCNSSYILTRGDRGHVDGLLHQQRQSCCFESWKAYAQILSEPVENNHASSQHTYQPTILLTSRGTPPLLSGETGITPPNTDKMGAALGKHSSTTECTGEYSVK